LRLSPLGTGKGKGDQRDGSASEDRVHNGFREGTARGGRQIGERVERFESRFGPVDDQKLAVLAQAAYLCWVNLQVEGNLFALCKAIRTGSPTSQYYHGQITADRWNEIHTYVVGVQRWLGLRHPVPPQIDSQKAEHIGRWLGEGGPAKEALAGLLLIRLVDDVLNYVSLARLGSGPVPDAGLYTDFSDWYFAPDGIAYAIPRGGDDRRLPFSDPPFHNHADGLTRVVRENMASSPDDAEELIGRVMRQTQPPCMHRFSRYLEIQITSIGVLKWRGSLLLDIVPKAEWQTFREGAEEALTAWADEVPSDGDLAERLRTALGEPTEQKRGVIRDLLLAGFWGDGDGADWHWLVPKAQIDGTNAYSLTVHCPASPTRGRVPAVLGEAQNGDRARGARIQGTIFPGTPHRNRSPERCDFASSKRRLPRPFGRAMTVLFAEEKWRR